MATPANPPLSQRERRFVHVFILTLAICYSPFKALAMLAPFILIAGLIFYVQASPINHLLKYIMALLTFAGISAFYALITPAFDVFNALLFLVTASSFLVLLYDLRTIATPALLQRLVVVVVVVVWIEALLGMAQGLAGFARARTFDVGVGDIVRGTIDPFVLAPPAASNAMFAILLSTLLIFLVGFSPARLSLPRLVALGIGLTAWVMASVLHTLIFFATAALLSVLLLAPLAIPKRWSRGRSSGCLILAGILLLTTGLTVTLLPANVRSAREFLRLTFVFRPDAPSEKTRATYNTLVRLPEHVPWQPLIGLGPGQYSSRASLIRSGQYLQGGRLPLPDHAHPLAERYILSEWRAFIDSARTGSTFFPFYSWLTVYGEFGLIGLTTVILLILLALGCFRQARSTEFPRLHLAMTILLLYVALLGFQDNYWELTQAILPAMLTLRIGYSYLARCQRGLEYPARTQRPERSVVGQGGLAQTGKP
ncbi:MAG: hypothetical protein RMK84_04295 [Oscillochloridaceae bacterium]|nr:hypothetical protein [Chloroflexaceae bacterium]MDW8389323.1 hypothetical protein [Oscillochloridaceae bacterium]